ncbi:PREDICTED: uncharacterized protein LOC106820289, partial [Priapulus caudatus]|uniref:Uncharacterized protein LOC106820289 n=1 Tax=Priapulus caudatus TaxID=37621 RepID=A0ABM1F774_PRICU
FALLQVARPVGDLLTWLGPELNPFPHREQDAASSAACLAKIFDASERIAANLSNAPASAQPDPPPAVVEVTPDLYANFADADSSTPVERSSFARAPPAVAVVAARGPAPGDAGGRFE